jgi:membrane protease YdiL (CAAX protease family)
MEGVVRDRDRVVGWIVAAVTVLALAVFGAEGGARWPWVGFSLLAVVPFVLLLVPDCQAWARARVAAHPSLSIHVPFALALYGMIAALASGSHRWLNLALWPVCVGVAVAGLGRATAREPPAGRLLLSGLALWALGGLWERALQIRVPGGTHLGLAYLVALDLALFLYLVARPVRTFDPRLGLKLREVGVALGAVAGLAAVAMPLGFAIGFLHVEPRWLGLGYAVARLFGLTLFVGLPEEMLFRGVFQESFSRIWNPRIGLILASVVFGLSHLPKHAPPLNWPYALLATVAGLAYGWVYQRTGRLAAAAVTHGAVDWLWSTYLGS